MIDPIFRVYFHRAAVIEWMLRNQLGRRNLNDFQRNEIALKYQEVIAKQMKERMKLSEGRGKKRDDQKNRPFSEPSTQRKEMAKIAGTSEGSIQRSKLILEKGTQEQIDRARKGVIIFLLTKCSHKHIMRMWLQTERRIINVAKNRAETY